MASELVRRETPGLTPRRWVVFLKQLEKGQTIRAACARAGFHTTTLYKALTDPANVNLVHQVEQAKNEGERRLVEAITNGAHTGDKVTTPGGSIVVKPGDWRAAAWLLEHHPHTRERYAAIQKQQLGGDPDNPTPIKSVSLQVVGDYDAAERRARIVTVLQKAGVMPIPDPDNPVIDVTPDDEGEKNGKA